MRKLTLLLLALTFACKRDKEHTADAGTMLVNTDDAPAGGPPGMVWIPGGEYDMGALPGDKEARPDELPRHRVR
ncbi:MAG: formylglycine-generating enzyme family protein, partial [Bacteroidia bacterium]|nr:formylglycine-generating enzyme family protein [Bacteroidia bacterium]